jgi:ribulose-phosphate 3-epimerase
MKVVPALLANDEADYRAKLSLVSSFTNFVQIDFMDGEFVPSRSIDAASAARIASPIGYEAHVMAVDPLAWLEGVGGPRMSRFIFHFEAVEDAAAVARAVRRAGYAPGVALNPDTPVSAVLGLLPLLDSALVMSVVPGFYGSAFIPAALSKAHELKAASPRLVLGLDGGVGTGNLTLARAAGFDYACVGSRIFQAENPARSFAELNALAGG